MGRRLAIGGLLIAVFVVLAAFVVRLEPVLVGYTSAGLPAVGTAGRLARVTDGATVDNIVEDNGSGWRSIYSRSTGVIVITDPEFGAVGDDSTDDAAAIQAAVDAVTDNGIIWCPAGNYRISVPITLPVRAQIDITFMGPRHAAGCQISPTTGFVGDALFDIGDGTILVERWTVDGISFRGRDGAGTELAISGVRIRRSAQWQIINSFFSSLEIGIEIPAATATSVGLIAHNVIGSNNVQGISADKVSDIRIIGNDLQEGDNSLGSALAIRAIDIARGGPRMLIANNKINDWAGAGIVAAAFGSNTDGFGTISGNTIENTGDGISLAEDTGATIVSNTITRTGSGGSGIDVLADDVSVVGNMISGHTDGINLGASRGTIVGNTIRNVDAKGIDIAGATFMVVSGNRIYDDQGVPTMDNGIIERLGADDNLIVGNHVTNSNTADITVAGASTLASENLPGDVPVITVDAATTFEVTSKSLKLKCIGPETIDTITGGITGETITILHNDSDCTLADDDDPTAADAINLTGAATNDVGATDKMIVLWFDGTHWLQLSESAN